MRSQLCLLAILGALLTTARPEVSPFSVRVEQVTSTDAERFKKTQEKKLKIFVSNNSSADANLTLKYYFFGHGAKDREMDVLEKGEKTALVKSHATEVVETPATKATFGEEHYETKKGGGGGNRGRGGGMQLGKKIQASGNKLTGYGVQILNGGMVVAEYFSEPSLKAEVGGAR
jgi:hypothetical protein